MRADAGARVDRCGNEYQKSNNLRETDGWRDSPVAEMWSEDILPVFRGSFAHAMSHDEDVSKLLHGLPHDAEARLFTKDDRMTLLPVSAAYVNNFIAPDGSPEVAAFDSCDRPSMIPMSRQEAGLCFRGETGCVSLDSLHAMPPRGPSTWVLRRNR
jgi:hypothetical protein